MKTNNLWKILAALTVLVLFHFTMVRLAEYKKTTTLAEREAKAAFTAERALGLRPVRFALPGSQSL
ncbi:MAG: hypothetical protein B9S32_12200 [Verrucomicrobia bacterium Tous-C9LFEB]|nr:MAG: hypothetical protein B9S32_12200 [Verrucomicrobia bacterium Tous-C9LFEB]